MTKPGPARLPRRLKIITGNPGKRPLNEDEPEPDALDDFSPPEPFPCGDGWLVHNGNVYDSKKY
jgi:hypothetical protein